MVLRVKERKGKMKGKENQRKNEAKMNFKIEIQTEVAKNGKPSVFLGRIHVCVTADDP